MVFVCHVVSGLCVPRGYVVFVCHVVMLSLYATWLCGLWVPHGYVVFVCHMISGLCVSRGYVVFMCHMVTWSLMPHD